MISGRRRPAIAVTAGDRARSRPRSASSRGHVLVSFVVSFNYVQSRSAHTTQDGQPRSQTLLNPGGRVPTDLESVLGQPPESSDLASAATLSKHNGDSLREHADALEGLNSRPH